jgi:hypothetical protein
MVSFPLLNVAFSQRHDHGRSHAVPFCRMFLPHEWSHPNRLLLLDEERDE